MKRIINFLFGLKHQDSKKETYQNLILYSNCLNAEDRDSWRVK